MPTKEEIELQFEETATLMRAVATGNDTAVVVLPGGGTVRSLRKIDKDAQDALDDTLANFGDSKQDKAAVDIFDGYPSLSGYKLRLKNAAGTVVSFLASLGSAVRNWQMPDKDGIVALVSDITDRMGAINGIATLDSNGLVPTTQLPGYVDDVLEFDTKALLTAATVGDGGQARGKIYIVLADESDSDVTNQYRWSGSAYVKMVQTPGTTDSIVEGVNNKYWTLARTVGSVLTGLSTATATVVTAADTILVAIGKLQAQISAIPFDTMTFVPGKPSASGKTLFIKSGRAFTIPANFAGTKVEALVAATGATVWTLTKNGATVGTFSWAAAGVIPTLATTGGVAIDVVVDDKLVLTAAGTQDATLADIGVHMLAKLT